MDAVFLMIVSFIGYIVAYKLYGKFLSKKIFHLDDANLVPSQEFNDGADFVPTNKSIIFGHHYTSIAGTGPIVGPAIGIIWGWVPAMIWTFFGSIFMGAVHDFGSLVISLRNQGRSISDITSKYVNKRAKYAFFLIVFIELLIVIAIFGLVIAVIFAKYPQSVFPVWMTIPIAIILGRLVYKKNYPVVSTTIIAVIVMYITVIAGNWIKFTMPDFKFLPATGAWTVVLLIYAFIASTLPVTTLLQPRDYINAWQLLVTMAILVAGILFSGFGNKMHIVAPAFNSSPSGAPPLWPFLFMTIACGAISGFHSLVSSGTTSKQIKKESDSLWVGYGSMIMEAVLATIIIIAVSAGIGMAYQNGSGEILSGVNAWNAHYSSWTASKGLTSKINAVVIGTANMISTLGIPNFIAIIIMGVFIASFAGTTLDSATRIQRYVVAEIFSNMNIKFMTKKYTSTSFAVITAAILAFITGANGSGALILWPMFGSVNQLLAALALLILTVYLKTLGGKKYLVSLFPCFFMLIMTLWCIVLNEMDFIHTKKYFLSGINGFILILAVWITIEGLITLLNKTKKSQQVDA